MGNSSSSSSSSSSPSSSSPTQSSLLLPKRKDSSSTATASTAGGDNCDTLLDNGELLRDTNCSNNNNNNINSNGDGANIRRRSSTAAARTSLLSSAASDRSSVGSLTWGIDQMRQYDDGHGTNGVVINKELLHSIGFGPGRHMMQQEDQKKNDNRTTKTTPSGRTLRVVDLPRMVHRNLPFHQSQNSVRMKNSSKGTKLWKLIFADWFHALLRLPSYVSVGFLLLLWTLLITFFGFVYWYLDNIQYSSLDCGLRTTAETKLAFMGAVAFSLETVTTVGYGLPGSSSAFFEAGCSLLQVTIFTEMVWSMMFNAFLFSFFFSLLSKSEFRSSQIIFTNKLLINVDANNKAYARLQCYDLDAAHPLCEAHARMYVLDHKLKMHPLRLADPNDDLGGVLYPSVPADIVHVIDHHSVLSPQKFPFIEHANGLPLRSIDSATGNRDEIICPICGEAYGTFARFKQHIDYNAMLEAAQTDPPFPPHKSHMGFVMPAIERLSLQEVRTHIEHTLSEIIVVVEAIDPQLSGTFQSLQSYKYEDLVFGAEFASCMSSYDGDHFSVDMTRFHKTRKISSSCSGLDHNQRANQRKSIFVDNRQHANTRMSMAAMNNNNNNNTGSTPATTPPTSLLDVQHTLLEQFPSIAEAYAEDDEEAATGDGEGGVTFEFNSNENDKDMENKNAGEDGGANDSASDDDGDYDDVITQMKKNPWTKITDSFFLQQKVDAKNDENDNDDDDDDANDHKYYRRSYNSATPKSSRDIMH